MNLRPSLTLLFAVGILAAQQPGGELRLTLRADPKTLDPLLVADEASQVVRYLTGGVLVRINRQTQLAEGDLAADWKIAGKQRIEFRLRPGVIFSDGIALKDEDVIASLQRLIDPRAQAPTPDSFRAAFGRCRIEHPAPGRVAVVAEKPVVNPEKYFDEVVIQPASPSRAGAVAGPFRLAERKPGVFVRLERNPHYWKRDAKRQPLPYLAGIRFDVVQNRDLEFLRFSRGEIHLINNLDAELYDRLRARAPAQVRDAGPSLDFEQLWFNQAERAPLPPHKKQWFRSKEFRRAVSMAIRRDDLSRIVFRGYARPAFGPVSPANRLWRWESPPQSPVPDAARALLSAGGFQLNGGKLTDKSGNPVEFTILTNAGSKPRERMASLIQQDLAAFGIRVSILTLDFPSLVERIMKTLDYEACLLGLVNVDLDPVGQLNTWLSSSTMHAWNPAQLKPETEWEAEIDERMQVVASNPDPKARKAAFDRVQEIVAAQAPVIYLVHKHILTAVGPGVRNVEPAVLFPQAFWNAERLWIEGNSLTSRR